MDFYVTFVCPDKPSDNIPRKSIASVVRQFTFQDLVNKFEKKVFEADYNNTLREIKEVTIMLKQNDVELISNRFSLTSKKIFVYIPEMFFNKYLNFGYIEKSKKIVFILNERKILNAWRKARYPKYWGIEDPYLPIKEKKIWINNHGSKELKKRFRKGLEHQKLYFDERMDKERPGWLLKNHIEGEEKEIEKLPEEHLLLETAKKMDNSASLIYWVISDDDDEEIILWEGYIVQTTFIGLDIIFIPENFPKNSISRKY